MAGKKRKRPNHHKCDADRRPHPRNRKHKKRGTRKRK